MELKYYTRKESQKECKTLFVKIGDNRFTLSQDVEGCLVVNKIDLSGFEDRITLHPSSSNEIRIK